MTAKLIDVRAFHEPLKRAGLVPEHCRVLTVAIGLQGGFSITYEVYLDTDQVKRLGAVLQEVADKVAEPAAKPQAEMRDDQ